MKANAANVFKRLFSIYPIHPTLLYSSSSQSLTNLIPISLFSSTTTTTSSSTLNPPTNPTQVFLSCGCTDSDVSKILHRQPALLKTNPTNLKSKLTLLFSIGLTSSDLVKIINCRPRFLFSRFPRRSLEERMEFFQSFFNSKELVLKALVRNPSLLINHLNENIKPCIDIYLRMGITKQELIPILISRPTVISRTALDQEKLECIRKTGVTLGNKMYKYVVSIVAISRIETIREKVANFEKFGFSSDEVLRLFGRSPLVLTLSIDKVQRNMTFVIGTMKLPASVVLTYPFLLYCNWESVLNPRFVVAEKVRVMGLDPQIRGPSLMRALRMTEKRFFKAFVKCHPKDVADQLMKVYTKAKGIKRLAEASKRSARHGFPF